MSNPSVLDLDLVREVPIIAEEAFAGWTVPEILMQWFCPRPWKVVEAEIDPRAGGIFATTMQSPEGHTMPRREGCLLLVEAPHRLVVSHPAWRGAGDGDRLIRAGDDAGDAGAAAVVWRDRRVRPRAAHARCVGRRGLRTPARAAGGLAGRTFAGLEELSQLPPTPRVAARLLLMAGGYGAWTDRSKRVLEVSQEQLGLMLALSRQTVHQSLRELEARGCIKRNRASIEVVDDELLRRVRDGS